MADQTAIDSALLSVINATLGAGSVSIGVELTSSPDKGVLVFNGYSLERLDFRQGLITYEYLLLFHRAGGGSPASVKDQLSDDLEAIREAIRDNATVKSVTHDARVATLLVQAGRDGRVLGVLVIEAQVIRS